MSAEPKFKQGDKVRRIDRHDATGTVIGYHPDGWLVVVADDGYDDWDEWVWELVPDEVTITIPRDVRDYLADCVPNQYLGLWPKVIEVCRASKAAEQ